MALNDKVDIFGELCSWSEGNSTACFSASLTEERCCSVVSCFRTGVQTLSGGHHLAWGLANGGGSQRHLLAVMEVYRYKRGVHTEHVVMYLAVLLEEVLKSLLLCLIISGSFWGDGFINSKDVSPQFIHLEL